MKVSICIGSACHLKGSHEIVTTFREQIEEKGLEDDVQLAGIFCLGNCTNAVTVKVEDEVHSVQPETAAEFFENEIVSRLA